MESLKVVVFKINNEEYAIDIMDVERILGYIECTKIPDTSSFIKGVIDYQKTILPIINTKERFYVKNTSYNEESKIIVVRSNDNLIGLSVDDVLEVADIFLEKIDDTPHIAKRNSNKYIKSIINKDNRLIILLDTKEIISQADLKAIRAVY